MKVLVVDDDAEVRATVVELLKGFGHTVVEATSAEEGLDRLSEDTFEFIISDWNMSGMTGVEFLSAVRSDPKTKEIPFIIVTSPGSEEVSKIEAAVSARVDAYVVKPFRGEILNTKINEVLLRKGGAAAPKKGALVVDDDEEARKSIIEIVKVLGHDPIFEAKDGAEGFDLLKEHQAEIGIVISDWEMPKLTGNKLLRKIRADKDLLNLPFIMVTSQTSIEQMKLMEAINAQVSHYLMKPFTIKDLEEKISIVLAKAGVAVEVKRQLTEAKEAVLAGRVSEARLLYRDMLKADPKNIPTLLALADTYLRDPQPAAFGEAITLMERAIQISPKSDAPHIALALAYEHAKSLERAILHLQEAAKEIPVSADIEYQLGRLTLKRGHSDEAVKHLNQALKINPELSDALNLLREAKIKGSKKK